LPKVRIRHVIPTVGPSAPAELVQAQELTLRSVERALRCVGDGVEVEVRAVRFRDEPIDCEWVTDCPTLDRSVLDLGEFEVTRRLPLLSDVLAALGDPSDYDVAVVTNVDIAVQPLFYELVAEIADEGHDAFSITRRTVQPRFRGSSLARFSTAEGTLHPGHDCFVMSSEIVERLIPCDVALGVRWVARTLLWQLQLNAENYRNFGDLHATFHVGDDRVWTNPKLADYEKWNESQVLALARELVARFGRARVSRLLSVGRFLDAIDAGTEVSAPPARTATVAYGTLPQARVEPRMVFSANSGRAGSGYLASLLDESRTVSAGHERPPQMTGAWTRRIAYEPRMASYTDRLVKVDALRSEVARIPPGRVYADTSHMFVKTFADVVFDEFAHDRLSVVVLRRDPVDVARSFFQLDFLGPRPLPWYDWMIPPTVPESAFPLSLDEVDDQFDLIFGYLVDIENRTSRLRELAPAVTWVDARLEEITQADGARALFEALDVAVPRNLEQTIAGRVNLKERAKSKVEQPVSRGHVEERLGEFLARHRDRRDLAAFVRNHHLEAP
jgi:hypothetical protein